ncbi:MAG: hypothetical protein K0U38_01740 [Epsilonproteobacteria bacterium]|nr:hypothetical protein [Campylobacterota bacterium]
MQHYKRWFQLITILVVLLFSSLGCVTKVLWEDDTTMIPYSEEIESFYYSKERGDIVFLGKSYHYIFNQNTQPLTELLASKDMLQLHQKQLNITTYTDKKDPRMVHTYIIAHFDNANVSEHQRQWLEKNQFRKQIVSERTLYSKRYSLRGERFIANRDVNKQTIRLTHPLRLQINEYHIESKNALYKIAMTPLSVTADAALVVVGAGVVGVGIILSPLILLSK